MEAAPFLFRKTNMIDIARYRNIIGMTIEEAKTATGKMVRATRVNGQYMVITKDYVEDRINVSTQDGKITHIRGFG